MAGLKNEAGKTTPRKGGKLTREGGNMREKTCSRGS